jgi:hypothetical protein
MTQSSEYPDLRWMPPKSWTNANRSSVQVVVIHATDGSEGATSAEDGASYDQRRTDGTSTHYFHDADSTIQCVLTADISHAAKANGNRIGIQHELCGRADQGAAGWADAASQGTIRQAARQVARDCAKWGIPVRRLTPAQVAAGAKGICGHVDITAAFPQDHGDHTDPGPTFPWTSFLALVQDFLNGGNMAIDDVDLGKIWGYPVGKSGLTAVQTLQNTYGNSGNIAAIAAAVAALQTTVAAVLANVVADDNDKAAILGDARAKHAELLAAVGQVDDELLAKLQNPATPDAQVAAALVSLLGARKNAVVALMQA